MKRSKLKIRIKSWFMTVIFVFTLGCAYVAVPLRAHAVGEATLAISCGGTAVSGTDIAAALASAGFCISPPTAIALCAVAVGMGVVFENREQIVDYLLGLYHRTKGEVTHWQVVDGKLYVTGENMAIIKSLLTDCKNKTLSNGDLVETYSAVASEVPSYAQITLNYIKQQKNFYVVVPDNIDVSKVKAKFCWSYTCDDGTRISWALNSGQDIAVFTATQIAQNYEQCEKSFAKLRYVGDDLIDETGGKADESSIGSALFSSSKGSRQTLNMPVSIWSSHDWLMWIDVSTIDGVTTDCDINVVTEHTNQNCDALPLDKTKCADNNISADKDTSIDVTNADSYDDVIGVTADTVEDSFPMEQTGEAVGELNPSIPDESHKIDWKPLELPLATKFPFCLPFDLYNSIKGLVVTKEAPKFDVLFPKGMLAGHEDIKKTIDPIHDFGNFEPAVYVLRWVLSLIFVWFLCVATRKMIRS